LTVTIQQPAYDKTQLNLALEASIYIGLAILLAAACLLILLPFIPLLAWGLIIAVATYPGFRQLQKVLGGRETLAAVVCTLILLAVVIVPAVLLGQGLVDGIQAMTARLKEGGAVVPPPPPKIESWPVIQGSHRSCQKLRTTNQKISTGAALGFRRNWFHSVATPALDSSCRSPACERRGCV
jgi:predicted PurR-regulated permease PerM